MDRGEVIEMAQDKMSDMREEIDELKQAVRTLCEYYEFSSTYDGDQHAYFLGLIGEDDEVQGCSNEAE